MSYNTSTDMDYVVNSLEEMRLFGGRLGALLKGGEVLSLSGDVGAGKTTLTKAIAKGMGIEETISSPSYVISSIYESSSGLRLAHYDFYRLDEAGILEYDLEEVMANDQTITILEWADIVAGILPSDHIHIRIEPVGEDARRLVVSAGGVKSKAIVEQL